MKVILSADSVQYPLTGIGRYTFELATHLQLIPEIHLQYLARAELRDSLPSNEQVEASDSGNKRQDRSGKYPLWLHQAVRKVPGAGLLYRSVLHRVQRRLLAGYEGHVYHGTNFYLPEFSGPKVVTVHDLSVFTWPGCHPRERVRVVRRHLKHALKVADAVITPSEYIRHELAEYFQFPLDRISAVLHGAPVKQFQESSEGLSAFLDSKKLSYKAYTLYLGTIEPRKNLLPLIRAYSRLPDSLRKSIPLVLCGYQGWESTEEHGLINQYAAEGWLKYLGYLGWDELPLLYKGARLFAFPSLYEGFGLPVLEAMQAGAPVICSRSSSLPEVAGDAACYFDPGDEVSLQSILEELLPDDGALADMAEAGKTRSGLFTWERAARETLAVYKSISSS